MRPRETLTEYLRDIHALEEQSLEQLRSAPDIAGEPALAAALRDHLEETERHERIVRGLLDKRGGGRSRFRDAIMKVGGDGFVMFARSQPDTPGKLATHALSYEALEWAAYDLLEKLALRAGDQEVIDAARTIREDESSMMRRIESLFDGTADASMKSRTGQELQKQLTIYLADAHALEAQSIQLLKSGRRMMDDVGCPGLLDDLLAVDERHREMLEHRLEGMDASPSALKDAALRIGAFSWAMFFRALRDTAARFAAFLYAVQYLEIGGYEHLRRVAERVGDAATADMAALILREERHGAESLTECLEETVQLAVAG
jgi:ferritin-like metal-binding protein YciE